MKKWALSSIAFLVLCLILIGAFLPSILSSDMGTRFIINTIQAKTKGKLEIEDLSLSWFHGQKIEKLEFSEGKGLDLSFDDLTTTAPFWAILFRDGTIGKTEIKNLEIRSYPKVTEKKIKALKKEKEAATMKKPGGAFWSNFEGHLIISNGYIKIEKSPSGDVSIQDLDVDLNIGETSSYQLIAKTRRDGQNGSISINGKQEGRELILDAIFDSVPVAGIDQLVSIFTPKYQGLLLAALGSTLDAKIMTAPTKTGLKTSAYLKSPRVFIELYPTYINEVFVLGSGNRASLTLMPEVFNFFSKDLLLKSDMKLDLRLDKGSLPLYEGKPVLDASTGRGRLTLRGGELYLNKIQKAFDLKDASIEFDTKSLGKLIDLRIATTALYQKASSSQVNGSLSIQNLLKTPSFPSFDLDIVRFPLSIISTYIKKPLEKYFGDTFSGSLSKSQSHISLKGGTPLCTLKETHFDVADSANLKGPLNFTYVVTPALYEGLSKPFKVHGDFNALTIPMDDSGMIFEGADFDMKIHSRQVEFTNLLNLGRAILPSLSASIKGGSLKSFNINGTFALDFAPLSWGYALLGKDLKIDGSGSVDLSNELKVSPLNLKLYGKKIDGDIVSSIEKGSFIIKKEFKLSSLLEPEQINPILSKDGSYPHLTNVAPISVEIKPTVIPLKKTKDSKLNLKGIGKIDFLELQNPSNRFPFDFKDVLLTFDFNTKSSSINFEVTALEDNAGRGTLEMKLLSKVSPSMLIEAPDTTNVVLSNFSTQIADIFLKTRGQLPDLIGKSLDLKYELKKESERSALDLQIKSPGLDLDGAFYLKDELKLRSPRKPLKVRWDLSERSYDAYRRWKNPYQPGVSNNRFFEVEGVAPLNIQVSSLVLPLKTPGKDPFKSDFNLFDALFDAQVSIDGLKLKRNSHQKPTELESFQFNVTKEAVGNTPLSFDFKGDVAPFGSRSAGSVNGKGTLNNFLTQRGDFDFNRVSSTIDAEIENFPSVFVDAFSKFDNASDFPPSAFLGELFNGKLVADIQESVGSLSLNVNASSCKAYMDAKLSHGVLYLKSPLKAVFAITPQLNDILEKSADLVVQSIEKPITLMIHDQGFNIPLKDLHIRNVSFKYGQLDLGKIVCRDTGSTSDVGGLLEAKGRNTISVWFAPSDFMMNKGKAYVDRTEILFDGRYEVCLWGLVGFPKRYVDMTLGLTADALRSSLGIQGLDDDYVLKVPVKGPFGNVKIDKASATSKIAFLLARKHLAPQTGVWGQVFGAVGALADDQSDVPPPKPPFPWQGSR